MSAACVRGWVEITSIAQSINCHLAFLGEFSICLSWSVWDHSVLGESVEVSCS